MSDAEDALAEGFRVRVHCSATSESHRGSSASNGSGRSSRASVDGAASVLESVAHGPDGEISAAERERLTTVAKNMTESLLEATDLLGGIPWSLVHEKHGISLFRADVGSQSTLPKLNQQQQQEQQQQQASSPCNVHAVCKFGCEIEDVAESLITNTTESFKQMMAMLSSDFLDGAVIEDIVVPSELNPHRYVALKWAAFKSSSPFTRDRDFVMLEYVDMIEDAEGQKIAFRIMESVDVPPHSRYAESSKYSRDVVPLMGFMYHTTKKPGELRMTYTCHFEKNGDLPAWAANSAIQSHVEKCINGILKYIETFRVNMESSIVLPQQHVIPMSEQQGHCCICQKNFCVLRRRYNCLKCGETVCSSCSSVRTAHVPDVGDRQLRVCTACVLESRRTSRLATPDSPAPLSSTASVSSMGRGFGSNTPRGRAVFAASTDPIDVASALGSGRSFGPSSCRGAMTSTGSFAMYNNNDDDDNNSCDNVSVCNSASSTPKRRSYDDVLEPVRSRLIEYKTFSSAAEGGGVNVHKASFPPRSFSDGLIMRRGALFSKRRGSPADLAISIEAFRLHRARMGGNATSGDSFTSTDEYTAQDDCGDASSDDGSCASSSPEHVSTRLWASSALSSRRSPSPMSSTRSAAYPEGGLLSPLQATRPVIESRGERRTKKVLELEAPLGNNQCSGSSPTSPMSESEASGEAFELSSAMQRAQDIIMATERTHHLAERVRKLSHHRILALQREDFALPAPQRTDNQQQHTQSPRSRCGEDSDSEKRRVGPVLSPSRSAGGNKIGAILYSGLDLEETQSPLHRGQVGSRSDSNQFHEYCPHHRRQHDLMDRAVVSSK